MANSTSSNQFSPAEMNPDELASDELTSSSIHSGEEMNPDELDDEQLGGVAGGGGKKLDKWGLFPSGMTFSALEPLGPINIDDTSSIALGLTTGETLEGTLILEMKPPEIPQQFEGFIICQDG